jgi:hypothetical protein
VIVWTIQDYNMWERLQRDGIVYGPSREDLLQDLADLDELAHKILFSYDWLARQMEQRIGPRPKPGAYPLWAWYQWNGADKRKPDLRSTGHLPPGTQGIRIELEIADNNILLSDFDAWYFPYCQSYLSRSEQENEAFEAEMVSSGFTELRDIPFNNPMLLNKMLSSWEKVFDLDYIGSADWDGAKTRAEKSIQGTFWQLSMDQVRKVTPFVSRKDRYYGKGHS